MIEIENLSKTYRGGVKALSNLTLTVATGMFGLVGPNGAGKTTLMRILAGLLRPSAGRVTAFGHDLATYNGRHALKMNLGYLPQELGLYPNLTAYEFLDYMAILKGITDTRERQHQTEELLEKVRLTAEAKRRLKTYSGGMKRRIGIAQALLGNPRLLIVDEPTAGLDPEERVRFRNLLADMALERTIILSTHIVEDISQSCNDLAVMRGGTVVFRGAPADLIDRARGHVWTFSGRRPGDDLTVVSTLHLQHGVQYRVLGHPGGDALPAEPTLEDGYMWLMQVGG
ncbi:MAG: ABC transporter ATP-binding protein [Chloroflexi bacterium]|uniref:ABC transporter ATP-binding protein n=1 Tax=Candidatus Flexifilum breve TaxID=3140694 RepID=UPI003136723B|nr:ABC transporter ATP-binding protein [Chloroflexota bacterium]